MMSRKGALLGTAAVFLATHMSGAAFAQNDDDQTLEVITVTAAKRAQTLQEVPIAVSVVNNDLIEKAQVYDLSDLQTAVPSLRITQQQTSAQTNFLIRGFGNGANNTGIENSVGVFIDGVYRSRSPSAILDFPVLERIEILRGPQSTLFGKNVSAGAISIVTKKPEQEFGGAVEATLGNFDHIGLKGTLTGPISETLSFRMSANYNKRDGYYTNPLNGEDINDRDRVGLRGQLLWEPADNMSFRLIADYNKIEEVCCGTVQLFNGPFTQFIGAPPPLGLGQPIGDTSDPFAREAIFNVNPNNELEGKGISLQGDIEFDWGTFTSITAYREQTDEANYEADFSGAAIASVDGARDFETFTQEFRLQSSGADNKVDWMVGAFFFDEAVNTGREVLFDTDTRAYIDGLTMGGVSGLETAIGLPTGTFFAPQTGILDYYTMDNTSYSFNAQVDFHVTDRLTFTGGLSYLKDKKTVVSDVTLTDAFSAVDLVGVGNQFIFAGAYAQGYADAVAGTPLAAFDPTDPADQVIIETLAPGTLAAVSAGAQAFADANDENPDVNPLLGLRAVQFFPVPVNFPNANETGVLKDDKWTYSLKMAYDLTDSINAYVSYSTGWKAGAFNLSSDSRPPNADGIGRSADPEDVKVWELGLKARFDRGNIYVAVFDQTIEGFQSNIFNGAGFSLANAGEQSVKGFEIETAYRPIDSLHLTAALTYLDPIYDSFVGAACADFDPACQNGEVTRDLSGTKPAGIHEVSATFTGTYTHDFDNGMEGFIRAEYIYESEVAAIENVPEDIASRKVNMLNASMGLKMENGLELSLWARNLTNNDFLLTAFPTVIQTGSYSGYANAPRTWGATARIRF